MQALEVLLMILVVLLVYTAIFFISYFIREKFLIYYKKWKYKRYMQKWEKDYEERLQRRRKRELHRKEKERYPLFYWKELENGSS